MSLDSGDLDPIAQAVLKDDSATVTGSLDCKPVGAISAGLGTLAILHVSGSANTDAGSKNWSTVIKAMAIEEQTEYFGGPLIEVDAYASTLFEQQAIGMRAARCYRIDRRADGQVWLWLEDLFDWVGPPWDIDQYLRACKNVGHFAGFQSIQDVPSAKFLSHDQGTKASWSTVGRVFMDLGPDEVTESVLKTSLPDSAYKTVMKIGDAAIAASPLIQASPQLLVHGDCHPRNLFLSHEGADRQEAVAIDWARIGVGRIGTDIGNLVGSGMTWHDDEFNMTLSSEKAFFESFLEGLGQGGWQGDRNLARADFLFGICNYGM
ncbi:MAG: phosphotransferase, partial [Chloroflexi bacterium]|nr:phosphotransferase [Chloroflexota bacterium]